MKENFTQGVYSGQIDVTGGKMHQVFLESQNNPSTDPLLVWLTGGPGCSSMLALFQEHGPVVFPDGSDTAVKNPYSWNTKANVLYIESPLGVGFNLGSLGTISDKTVTADNLVFLQNWYKMWPQFKKNRLFLVGESYAGIYVPWFANAVVEANKTAADKIPLEGIMVGNGCTDQKQDTYPAAFETAKGFNILPDSIYNDYKKQGCDKQLTQMNLVTGGNVSQDCMNVFQKFQAQTQGLLIYDQERKQYHKQCTVNGNTMSTDLTPFLSKATANLNKRNFSLKNLFLGKQWRQLSSGTYNPFGEVCGAIRYLNRADVKKALHIDPSFTGQFQVCNMSVNENYQHDPRGSYFLQPILKAAGVRLLKYSGDTDGAVPTWGTRQWIKDLNWPVKSAWAPWYVPNDKAGAQIAGYATQYEGLTFTTIHGVGHMAPQWKRLEALTMIQTFIDNKPFPQ